MQPAIHLVRRRFTSRLYSDELVSLPFALRRTPLDIIMVGS
jgi:hypothetical protein